MNTCHSCWAAITMHVPLCRWCSLFLSCSLQGNHCQGQSRWSYIFRFIIAHILLVLQICKGLFFKHKCIPQQTQADTFGRLYNMLYIFKTSLYSLWKDKYNLLDKLLYKNIISYRTYYACLQYYYKCFDYICFENTYMTCYIQC